MIKSKTEYFRNVKLNCLGLTGLREDVQSVNKFLEGLFSDLYIFEERGYDYRYKYLCNDKGFYIVLDEYTKVMYIESFITIKYDTRDYVHRTALEYIITDMIYDKLGVSNYNAHFLILSTTPLDNKINVRPYDKNKNIFQ